MKLRAACSLLLCGAALWAQSTGATFGEIVRLGGAPSDAVLDESRQRIYLVNQSANRVDAYSYIDKAVVRSYTVGTSPVAAALSADLRYLYVSNNGSSSLSVIDLSLDRVVQTVSLNAKPEGVAAGIDGRVLISTEGTSSTDQVDSLLIYDASQAQGSQVQPVPFPPPPATPTGISVTIGRPTTTFRGKLAVTADGAFIIGLSTVNNNSQTIVFVYEVRSGSILRSRTVTGQSTVLSVAPDGSRFMAGYTMYDTATLNVIGQYHSANVPFPLSSTGANFNSIQNMGGSAFAPDGSILYSAFNVAPATTPATRPQASTLLISNPRNLAVSLGIKIPESIVAKMLILSNGEEAWGLSESGLVYLPLGKLYDYPILMPETTTVFLSWDDCTRGLAKASLRILNLGRGKLTFSVPDPGAALVAQATSGVAPSTIEFTMEPGRTNITRYYGTNLYSGASTNTGTAVSLNLSSPDAINIPNTIRVFMNYRHADQRGVVYPLPTGLTVAEGLQDIVVDEKRNRVYISNAGYNRIEVFAKVKQRFVEPMEAGQLPHQMALSSDGQHLWVANTGGESIARIDLDTGKIDDAVVFPARPRSGAASPVSPQAIAPSVFGLQIAMSDGSLWKVVDGVATLRPSSALIPSQISTTGNNGPVRMMATLDERAVITMAGNGTLYRYDAMADAYTNAVRPYTLQNITGYYGPLAAGPDGSYVAANSFILSSSLSLIGGSESPSSSQALPAATRRNVAALGAIDEFRFLRFTTPVKQQVTSTPTTDPAPTLELVDLRDNSVTVVGSMAENPAQSLYGTQRLNVPPRQIAVDKDGMAYVITLSGLTVVPLAPAGASRPQVASVMNANDGTRILRPGSFVAINGLNLAWASAPDQTPPPTVTGGSCVTFSNLQLPILKSAPNQIIAQAPASIAPGSYVAVVRSLATGQRSDPVLVTVQ